MMISHPRSGSSSDFNKRGSLSAALGIDAHTLHAAADKDGNQLSRPLKLACLREQDWLDKASSCEIGFGPANDSTRGGQTLTSQVLS